MSETEPQGITFSGFSSEADILSWKEEIEKIGFIQFFYILQSNSTGYAIVYSKLAANAIIDEYNNSFWPKQTQNQISVSDCTFEEINAIIQLSNKFPPTVSVEKPDTLANLYNMTRTFPPIFWQYGKEE